METRTYTQLSNARRAARKAGVDPHLVFATDDGFTFPTPEVGTYTEVPTNGHDHQAGNGVDTSTSAEQMKAKHAANDQVDTNITKAAEDDDDIPAFCRISAEDRKAAWDANPPKAAPIRETTPMAKTSKSRKGDKPAGKSGADKNATLLSMLKGKGSTVEAMTKALGWLPHTLRARISRLGKAKSKGGEGMKIERQRTDGVTTYRSA